MISLYDHQIKGSEALLKYKKYCLFFEVGTGKTFTALDALSKLPPGRVLIVAPKRPLEKVWIKDKEFPLTQHKVTYINYEKVARHATFHKDNTFDYIIYDEAHKLKGKTTKTSRKFGYLSAKAKYVWGLTGTPVSNSYVDVYCMFKALDIKEFSDLTYDAFIYNYYFTKVQKTASGFNFPILLGVKKARVEELMTRIGKSSMTKLAKDCIDLPDKRIEIVEVEGMRTKQYDEIEDGIFKTPTFEKTMIKLETYQKLHQAANGYVYYGKDKQVMELKGNKKALEFKALLDTVLAETERTVCVYYYQEDLRRLQEVCGTEYSWTLDSDEFPNKQILFIQYQQSEGLNLQHDSHCMIYYSYDYSYQNFEQMCGRIYRNGQRNNVVYYIMVAKNTIEENIWNAIKNKKSRAEFLKEVLGE